MSEDTRDTGMPTRAIHESYLSMQQAHQQYRSHRDNPKKSERPAHANYQQAVLTFYELIRSHLKRQSGMSTYWHGELPDYPTHPWSSVDHARQYIQSQGTAIWGLQKHVETVPAQQQAAGASGGEAIADGGGRSLAEWHDELGLGDRQRVVAVRPEEEVLLWIELRAVAGLQQLDTWDTEKNTERNRGSGFMASETATNTELEYVPVAKLTAAKRLLGEAADKMNLLSRVDIDHEDGAIVNFDQSRDDVDPEYRAADYDNSPDI